VRADEKLTAFLELQGGTPSRSEFDVEKLTAFWGWLLVRTLM